MSRDGQQQCCGDPGSISLAETTAGTGRRAGISFHNAGYDEGNLALEGSRDGSGRGRRLVAYDNQGQGMRIEADDFFIRNAGGWASSYWRSGAVVAGCMGYNGWGIANCWNGAGTWASGFGMSCPGGSWRAGALCTDGNCEGGFLCIAY